MEALKMVGVVVGFIMLLMALGSFVDNHLSGWVQVAGGFAVFLFLGWLVADKCPECRKIISLDGGWTAGGMKFCSMECADVHKNRFAR